MRIWKRLSAAALSVLLIFSAGGCENMTREQKKAVAAIGGGVVGGLVGSQLGSGSGRLVGSAVGTLVGAGAGYLLADYLTREEQQEVNRIVEQQVNQPVNQASQETWRSDGGDKTVQIATTAAVPRNRVEEELRRTEEAQISDTSPGIPEDTVCRYNTKQISVEDDPEANPNALYCRTTAGTWKRVDIAAAS
jgi:outer membrane lipoprotein SlyB